VGHDRRHFYWSAGATSVTAAGPDRCPGGPPVALLASGGGVAGIGIAASPRTPSRGRDPRGTSPGPCSARVTIAVWPAFRRPGGAAPRPLGPGRLRLRRRHRRLRRPAQLAVHRNPRRQRPGPGRAAERHRSRPAGRSSSPVALRRNPAPPVPAWPSAGAAGVKDGGHPRGPGARGRQAGPVMAAPPGGNRGRASGLSPSRLRQRPGRAGLAAACPAAARAGHHRRRFTSGMPWWRHRWLTGSGGPAASEITGIR